MGRARGGAAERLIETRAVAEEEIRLYPPLAAISREAVAPDELAGHTIAAGTTVETSPGDVKRSTRTFSGATPAAASARSTVAMNGVGPHK